MRRYLPFWPALAVFLLIFAIAISLLATRMRFDNAPEAYLPKDAPSVVFENELRQRFPTYELEVVLFRAPEGQADTLFGDDFLNRLDELSTRLEAHARVARVITVSRMDHIEGTPDGFSVTPLLGAKQRQSLTPEARRQRALDDRFAPGLTVSRDGQALALIVRPKDLHNSLDRIALHADIGGLLDATGLTPWVAARAGQVPLDVAQFDSMLRDNMSFVPATIGVGLLLVWLLFRRRLAVGLTLLMILASLYSALAALAAMGQPFTLVSAILPPFMAALCVASVVHFYNALAHAGSRGLIGRARVEAALDEVQRPSFYAILTTVAGLLSLATSTIQPIRSFGLAGSAGMCMLYLLLIHVLPGLVERWDRAAWPLHQNSTGWMQRMVDGLARFSLRKAGYIALAFLVVTLAGLPLLGRIEVRTNIYQFFSDSHAINQSTHAVETALSGVMPLDLVFQVPERDGLLSPERLKAMQAVRDHVETLPGVDRSLSMLDLLEEMNWAFHGSAPEQRRLPENRQLIAQYLLLYDGRDLQELADRDFTRARLNLSLRIHDTGHLRELMGELRRWLDTQDLHGMTVSFASEARIFTEQEDLLIQGQIGGIWSSVLAIFVFMLFMCRNVVSALICMIVNVTPIALVFMLMGGLGIPLDMATALIACIAVGIAIDDTVHTFSNTQEHLRRGASITRAIIKTYREAGRAVTITTIILCSQFFLLVASAFIPTREFGFLTGTGLLIAFAFDLLLMPALLILRARSGLGRTTSPLVSQA